MHETDGAGAVKKGALKPMAYNQRTTTRRYVRKMVDLQTDEEWAPKTFQEVEEFLIAAYENAMELRATKLPQSCTKVQYPDKYNQDHEHNLLLKHFAPLLEAKKAKKGLKKSGGRADNHGDEDDEEGIPRAIVVKDELGLRARTHKRGYAESETEDDDEEESKDEETVVPPRKRPCTTGRGAEASEATSSGSQTEGEDNINVATRPTPGDCEDSAAASRAEAMGGPGFGAGVRDRDWTWINGKQVVWPPFDDEYAAMKHRGGV